MNFPLSILGMNAVGALAGNAHVRYFIFHLVYIMRLHIRHHLLKNSFNNSIS
jgi:hypothetical protein